MKEVIEKRIENRLEQLRTVRQDCIVASKRFFGREVQRRIADELHVREEEISFLKSLLSEIK